MMTRLLDGTGEDARELATLLEVSRDITSTLELEPLLELILDRLKAVVDYTSVSIFAREGDSFTGRAYRGPLAKQYTVGVRLDAADEYYCRYILEHKQPVRIPNIHGNSPQTQLISEESRERLQQLYDTNHPVHAWLGVPLITRERVTGLLILYHRQPDYFTDRHVVIVTAFANQVAVAIENAQLFEAEQRRAEQFRAISEIGRRITSILSVDELLCQTAKLVHDTMSYYHVHLALIEGDMLVFKACSSTWWSPAECSICMATRLRVGIDGICGWVTATGETALVPDVSKDPRFIPGHEGQAGSELVLPVKVKGQIIGVLDVQSERLNAFDEVDVNILQSLADQVAVAIENAQLYAQAQQLAALQERQKLARELHDSVSQALFGIALGAHTARAQLARDPDKVAEPLDYVLSLAEAALAEMRALIFELRPESLEKEGLVAALTRQAAMLRARHRIEVNTTLCDEPEIPLQAKQALYRITQEALHNIVKHARASRVDLRLECAAESVALEVRDNGAGFDTTADFPGHLGLRSMRERVGQLGGAFSLDSSPGRGTRLDVRIPISEVAPAHPTSAETARA